MPHRKKKPFIENKKAVTFHLVHRSQRDPLAADETAPQRVLLPADKADTEKRKEEQRDFGVFFDDDYNYLQHLKERGPSELIPSATSKSKSCIITDQDGDKEKEPQHVPGPSINLPSSVFASEFEEDVGLLNKAAPVRGLCLDLDPDIVAALDEDFDFDDPENQLDDDFILQANSDDLRRSSHEKDDDDDDWEDVESGSEENDYDSDGTVSDEDDGEGDGARKEFLFMQEETKSRFTEYSMTSSVIRRNEQLTLLDERFEKFYEQFDDDEIGALDNTELEGFIDSNSGRLEEVINDYYKQKAKDCVKLKNLTPRDGMDSVTEEDDEDKEDMQTIVIEEPREKWDCESILSTYSNLYNHPQIIKDPPKAKLIRVSVKTGIPMDVLPGRGLTAKQVERMEMINSSDIPRVSTHPRKDESKEERKARKQAIKEERKERRVEKKSNKLAFKEEKSRQVKEQLNLKQNLQGLKLS
ncbi:protein LTV1 homolog isoform X1 [Xenopus laevis]|uniref:Protein LTV1 homolog n=2 Tax=Xenopus laevis TaxID=8355 RepID=LTV1_XENLA|nr:protein LTV1 homolog [Xenopus laevis]XP_018117343.1 protein LTV1 homolog isoform X1 [Xenopus laevis]Q4V838.1 RecName: Full=Protein LTV1 homolog [Xenopus laevis]AAH97559.1 LOC443630 protein [Xenopus laevis]OCT80226.1 hypothetical protein XELAEV_18027038mg [Xenopus laevis]OCT80227.1 hypothetical protein XELAEV_18027038mg [Xenopus laevis]